MSSKEEVIAGITHGVLSWTEEKLREFIIKFKNRELAFVNDVEVINVAKEKRTTSEWDLFGKYIEDRNLRIMFQMGLTLRHYEDDQDRVESIRRRIFKKYGTQGLHIAQFVQNGFFGKLLGNILVRSESPEKLKDEIQNILNDIERICLFVQSYDNTDRKTEDAIIKIQANNPKTFIISSSMSAMGKCEKIRINVMKRISGYDFELVKTKTKEIYFLNREEP